MFADCPMRLSDACPYLKRPDHTLSAQRMAFLIGAEDAIDMQCNLILCQASLLVVIMS